jgi:hypothetical protein
VALRVAGPAAPPRGSGTSAHLYPKNPPSQAAAQSWNGQQANQDNQQQNNNNGNQQQQQQRCSGNRPVGMSCCTPIVGGGDWSWQLPLPTLRCE